MKKKICIVVSSPMTVNAFLLHPIRKLSQHYDVYIAVNAQAVDLLADIQNLVTVLPVPIERKISPLRDMLALLKLIQLFRRYNFKLVHSITPKAGLLGMMAAFIARVETRIHTFTGQVWMTRSGIARSLLKNMDKAIALFSTYTLADGVSQRKFLLDEGIISENTSSVLAQGSLFGVDTGRFKPDDNARKQVRDDLFISEEDTVFLFIGRLTRDKGVLDLAAAFAGTNNPKTHLLVVGVDEEHMLEHMLQLTKNCSKQIHTIGFTDKPEHYIAAADVLCLPSYREGFNNAVIESAAVGIPTIGSRIYGVVDSIIENKTGLLFEARDVHGLQTAMATLANDKALRNKLGQRAMARVQQQFTCEKLSSAWLEFYKAKL